VISWCVDVRVVTTDDSFDRPCFATRAAAIPIIAIVMLAVTYGLQVC
jgi:hypothetical protein